MLIKQLRYNNLGGISFYLHPCFFLLKYNRMVKFGLSNEVIADICKVFKNHSNIDKVMIFGSRARGNFSAGSDIDLALIGNDISFNQILDIGIQIDDLDLLYKVDVIDYNKRKGTPIGDQIDKYGLLFYERE